MSTAEVPYFSASNSPREGAEYRKAAKYIDSRSCADVHSEGAAAEIVRGVLPTPKAAEKALKKRTAEVPCLLHLVPEVQVINDCLDRRGKCSDNHRRQFSSFKKP